MDEPRELLVSRLITDLMGPSAPFERLSSRPTDRYLTGILFPQRALITDEADDGLLEEEGGRPAQDGGGTSDGVPAFGQQRPASAGLSFAIRPNPAGEVWCDVRITGGRYEQLDPPGAESRASGREGAAAKAEWVRVDLQASLSVGPILQGSTSRPLAANDMDGLDLHVSASCSGSLVLVTITVVNATVLAPDSVRDEIEKAARFRSS